MVATAMALTRTQLRCQACRRVVMEVTGLVEVAESCIGIRRRCKCGHWCDWKVRVVE